MDTGGSCTGVGRCAKFQVCPTAPIPAVFTPAPADPCMKTWGLGGRLAASWRSLPLTRTALALLQVGATAGLWSPQVKIRDSRHSDFGTLKSEVHCRRPRTDHMATSHQSCLKATVSSTVPGSSGLVNAVSSLAPILTTSVHVAV